MGILEKVMFTTLKKYYSNDLRKLIIKANKLSIEKKDLQTVLYDLLLNFVKKELKKDTKQSNFRFVLNLLLEESFSWQKIAKELLRDQDLQKYLND